MWTSFHFLRSRRAALLATEVGLLADSLRLHGKSSAEEREVSYTTLQIHPKNTHLLSACAFVARRSVLHSCSGGERTVACTIDFSFSQHSHMTGATRMKTLRRIVAVSFSSLFVPVCSLSLSLSHPQQLTHTDPLKHRETSHLH